ncbi:hypothetical protein C8R46DRAFT_893686 [Mycena filopes]|nr:hypothetical protein C8R46DRAFT_893686 [Mycena filopes]
MPRAQRTDLEDSPSPRKRVSKGKAASTSNSHAVTTPRSRGRGKLRMLPEMPLDILFEIFSHLEPPDVMRLSRTTKDLRNVLMRHSAISIWKSAFSNDPDLPGLPEGMTEPQYANLAFSPHCHSCFVQGEHSILWAFGVRLCPNCVLQRNLPKEGKKSWRTYKQCGIFFLRDSKADYLIFKHASKAVMSVQLRLARKQRLLEEARERRKADIGSRICKRLSDIGYGDEVEFINNTRPEVLSEHTLVKSETVLTDRVWDNIKPKLVLLMQSVTEKMQRRKRKALLKNRQRLLLSILKQYSLERPIDEVHPRFIDVCVLPHIKAMLEDPSMDAYTTEESFQEVIDDLPRLFAAWREEKTLSLLHLLPGGPDRDLLLRATTYFRCASCKEPIAYPRILAHKCLSDLQHGHRNRDDDLTVLCISLDSEPWNCDGKRVAYYPTAEASAHSVVRACGFDTEVTTVQDMDDVNPWIECVCCSHKVRGRAVFRWRKGVGPFVHGIKYLAHSTQILHDMYHAASSEPAMWRLLNETDTEAAEALQEKLFETDYRHDVEYTCTKCREQFSYLGMRGHLRVSHGINSPEIEEDYVLRIDASMDQPPFPMMLPHGVPEVIELLDDDTDDDAHANKDCIVIDSD